ncbi:Permease of the drug/metabolite transporter (DMT) superfamily [Klebsiella pneumoniae IS10]|nr:Permease of the drug/metabolite transporter (DMT) superfamily [Klebsiella pneumoniae IS10]
MLISPTQPHRPRRRHLPAVFYLSVVALPPGGLHTGRPLIVMAVLCLR